MLQPLYRSILDNEGHVSIVKARAAEMLQKDKGNVGLGRKLETLDAVWNPLLTAAKGRHARLEKAKATDHQWQTAKSTLEEYLTSDESLLADISAAAPSTDPDVCAHRVQRVQDLKSEMVIQGSDYKAAISLGDELITCTERDSEEVQDSLDGFHDRWEKLRGAVKKLEQRLEKEVQLWKQYSNSLGDAKSALEQCQEQTNKLPPTDPNSLVRLKGLLEDLQGPVHRKIKAAEVAARNIDPSMMDDEGISGLGKEAEELRSEILDKIARVEVSEDMVRDFHNLLAGLAKGVKGLQADFGDLGPLARDPPRLESQERQTEDFLENINPKEAELSDVRARLEDLSCKGMPSEARKSCVEKISKLEEDMEQLGKNGRQRMENVGNLREDLTELLEELKNTRNGIVEIMFSDVLQQSITGDLQDVRVQLENLRNFKDGLEPLSHRVENLLDKGKDLVKSAAPGVDTSLLESAMNDLSDSWKELKLRLSEREQTLDGAILGLGNYKDAHNSMLNWLEDTEDLMANQREPSSDYKVVKAQMQEQRLLQKLIDDKRPNVEGFIAMVEQIERLAADENERQQLRAELNNVTGR